MSFEVIIPFLKPIEHLLESHTLSEIMVNPDGSVWIEEKGQVQHLPDVHFEDGALQTGLEVIANRFGKKLDANSPILNLRLPAVRSPGDGTEGRQSELSGVEAFRADDTWGVAVEHSTRRGNRRVPGSW